MLLRLRQACDHPLLVRGFDSNSSQRLSIETAKKLPQERLTFLLSCLSSLSLCGICNVCSYVLLVSSVGFHPLSELLLFIILLMIYLAYIEFCLYMLLVDLSDQVMIRGIWLDKTPVCACLDFLAWGMQKGYSVPLGRDISSLYDSLMRKISLEDPDYT